MGVIGNYYLQTKTLDGTIIYPAFAIGLYSATVLNLNNLRDHVNDKAGGKNTLVVRLGFSQAKVYHIIIVLLASHAAFMGIWKTQTEWYHFLPLVPVFLQLILLAKVIRTINPADLDGELKKVALLTFFYAILLFMTSVF